MGELRLLLVSYYEKFYSDTCHFVHCVCVPPIILARFIPSGGFMGGFVYLFSLQDSFEYSLQNLVLINYLGLFLSESDFFLPL